MFKKKRDISGLTKREKKQLLKILSHQAILHGCDVDGDSLMCGFNLITGHVRFYDQLQLHKEDSNNE